MSAEKGGQSNDSKANDWAIRFTKEGSLVFAKLMGRVIVLAFAFIVMFGGPYEAILRSLGKDATWVMLFLLITLTFTVPRLIRRFKREELVISQQGIVLRQGFKETKRVAFAELSGYRASQSRFASGSIELCSQMGAVTWVIPEGFAEAQDIVAALDRGGLKALEN